jgi:hypothetical protein
MQREIRNTRSPAFATSSVAETSTSARQIISDIALLAFWGAMVPTFLWIGNAAGF